MFLRLKIQVFLKLFNDPGIKIVMIHSQEFIFDSNSLLTEPSAPTARPPAGGSLHSPTPPPPLASLDRYFIKCDFLGDFQTL